MGHSLMLKLGSKLSWKYQLHNIPKRNNMEEPKHEAPSHQQQYVACFFVQNGFSANKREDAPFNMRVVVQFGCAEHHF